jgi:phosphoglycolate phosphatase
MTRAAVIFDLDGTLIDSAPDIHAAANRVLRAEGLDEQSFAQVRSFIGRGVPHLIRQLLSAAGHGGDDARHARMTERFVAGYEEAVGLTLPYPGVAEALDSLRAAGHPLGICTNKPEAATRAVLAHLGLLAPFTAIVGGDSLPVRKPDPAPLHLAVSQLGQPRAIFVGDSEVDAETAQAAGLPFLLFTEGYRKSPVEDLPQTGRFSDYAELPGLIAAMG